MVCHALHTASAPEISIDQSGLQKTCTILKKGNEVREHFSLDSALDINEKGFIIPNAIYQIVKREQKYCLGAKSRPRSLNPATRSSLVQGRQEG